MIKPFPDEIAQARLNAGGWVYRIAGDFGPFEGVPREAIVGAWKVDERGKIIGSFIPNSRYDAKAWPA